MSALTIQMTGNNTTPITKVIRALKQSLGGEYISESWHELGDATAVLLSYEKYFFRNGSYTGLTVMLTEGVGAQYADIVGFGGGSGLFNISWGSNSEYADDAARILQSLGFRVTARE